MANLHPTLLRSKNYLDAKMTRLVGNNRAAKRILPLFACALVVAVIASGVLGYQAGERQGRQVSAVVATDYKGTKITNEDVQNMRIENDLLKSEVSTLIQERDISLNNLNLMREEMQSLRIEYDELKSLNELLTANANLGDVPLEVVDVQINALEGGAYEYRFDVLVASLTEKRLVPRLTLLNPTSMVEVPLKPSSYDAKGLVTVRGKFMMPEGFAPSQLRLVLNLGDKQIVKLYNWRVNNG